MCNTYKWEATILEGDFISLVLNNVPYFTLLYTLNEQGCRHLSESCVKNIFLSLLSLQEVFVTEQVISPEKQVGFFANIV